MECVKDALFMENSGLWMKSSSKTNGTSHTNRNAVSNLHLLSL